MKLLVSDKKVTVDVVQILEFSSDRKRMSVIIRDNGIAIFTCHSH
jgi:magnesium-transporting ATPase (P-type)